MISDCALSAQPAFDYYKLALQWVPGVLTATGICPATVVSRLLTIHGLWPSNKARPHPSGCPFVAYNSTKINSLKLDLGIAWPTIYGSDDDFWRRQWEKHGICSTFDQCHYFKHTLDIWKAHNVTLMLEDNGIVPGGKYDYGRIERTILKKTGSNPHITCTGNKYLGEIHLCFDAATPTNFVPCSSSGGSKCNTNPIEFVT
ncbi:putative ribonuclease T(2) [Medicago truncatula]|uniref:Putative ribonuclease T(2) n=1 Tax=Medicago truncatula TaxID=3880 RepID=A0A396J786_MEDTR|nr:putative ribonuclease T(2) [Medicago truncatula]